MFQSTGDSQDLPSLIIDQLESFIGHKGDHGDDNKNVDKYPCLIILIIRLLVAVVLVFTISWLPLNLINVLLDLGVDQKMG